MSPRTGIIIYFNAHKDYGFITADGARFSSLPEHRRGTRKTYDVGVSPQIPCELVRAHYEAYAYYEP
jgi:hypothetical protein